MAICILSVPLELVRSESWRSLGSLTRASPGVQTPSGILPRGRYREGKSLIALAGK
jgi:hypothetical protein